MNAAEEMLTYKDVSKLLAVDVRTVQRIVQSGDLPRPLTISRGAKRFKPSWIEAYLERQESKSSQ
jgi:excisionase family DNA binding protein